MPVVPQLAFDFDADPPGKRCSKCRQEKPLTEFSPDKHKASGYCCACKPCRARNTARWREANREAFFTAALNPPTEGGKRCPRCGEEKPWTDFSRHCGAKDGKQVHCQRCQREGIARYRAERRPEGWQPHVLLTAEQKREKRRRYAHHWRAKNPERARELLRQTRGRHRDKYNARSRERLRSDALLRSKRKAAASRWYQAHKDHHREYCRRWFRGYYGTAQGKAKTKARYHNRRARQKAAGGEFTAAEFLALCEQYGNRCLRCGAEGNLTADHVIPIVRGGSNEIGNIQPLCRPCNSAKSTRTTDYRTSI